MFRGSQGVVRLKVRHVLISSQIKVYHAMTVSDFCHDVFLYLQTGPRTIPDTGPDLVAHRTSDFAADLALPSPTVSVTYNSKNIIIYEYNASGVSRR